MQRILQSNHIAEREIRHEIKWPIPMTLPIEEHNFAFTKGLFRDALCLRYDWTPPHYCVCGSTFSTEHALSCPCGGLPSIRHNNIREFTAKLLTEVCPNVEIEPALQPLTGERLTSRNAISGDEARLDVRAQGFWGDRGQCAFFDVRVFNPLTPSNSRSSINTTYRHESLKRRSYKQRVREVEHGPFTPLVFSATRGMAPAATIAFKRLASLLADKRQQTYNKTISWLRCSLSFSLVRSAVSCLRGARSSFHHPFKSDANIPLLSVRVVSLAYELHLLSQSLNTELLFITPTVVYVYIFYSALYCIVLCTVLYCIVVNAGKQSIIDASSLA